MTVVGIVHSTGVIKEGDYKGQTYDNFVLHCLKDANPERLHEQGQLCVVYKVKSSIYLSNPVKIGDDIVCYFDEFKRVVDVRIL